MLTGAYCGDGVGGALPQDLISSGSGVQKDVLADWKCGIQAHRLTHNAFHPQGLSVSGGAVFQAHVNRVVNNQGGRVADGSQERGRNSANGRALGSAGPAPDHRRQQRTNVYTLFYGSDRTDESIIVAFKLGQKCGVNKVTLSKTPLFVNDRDCGGRGSSTSGCGHNRHSRATRPTNSLTDPADFLDGPVCFQRREWAYLPAFDIGRIAVSDEINRWFQGKIHHVLCIDFTFGHGRTGTTTENQCFHIALRLARLENHLVFTVTEHLIGVIVFQVTPDFRLAELHHLLGIKYPQPLKHRHFHPGGKQSVGKVIITGDNVLGIIFDLVFLG